MSLSFEVMAEREGFRLQATADLGGGVTGLLGPNGSGKSTLLHALAGLVPATGWARVGDHVLQDGSGWRPPEAREVGLVFQDLRLFPHLSVRRNLAYGARIDTSELVELLGLGALLDRMPGALSGGERQRVALARALVTRPRVLLLDEPFSALDLEARSRLMPWLRRAVQAAGIPVVVVSHRLDDLLALTDQLAVMEAGRVVACGPADEVLGTEVVMALAHRMGLENVLKVTDAREEGGLVRASLGDQQVWLPSDPPPAVLQGGLGRVRLRPEDIVLAVDDGSRTSARNQICGTILSLSPVPGRVVARVDVGCPLSVELTDAAIDDLGLAVGSVVWCRFKTTALRWS